MLIQEMRSGMTHLKKKTDEHPAYFEGDAVELELPKETTVGCDLSEPEWSVVSFDQIEAGGMTHSQASVLLSELEASGVFGLCLVTDAAAARIRTR